MKSKKKYILLLLVFTLLLTVACGKEDKNTNVDDIKDNEISKNYPEKPINLIVPWSVGGITDRVARMFQPIFEEKLGQPVKLINKEGASGAIGTEYAYSQPADGYTVLFSAETPSLFNVMGLNELGFDNFEFLRMLVHDTKVIVVPKDSKYETFESLLIDIKENPGKIKMSYSGPGASGHLQGLLLKKAGLDVSMTPYGGGSPAMVATISGEVDFTFGNYATVKDYLENGDLIALATFTNEQSEILKDVEPITKHLPEIEDYLPMYFPNLILVKEGTDEEIKDILIQAIDETVKDERWQKFLIDQSYTSLADMTEEEIKDYWEKYTSINSYLLYDEGVVKTNPEDLGIKRFN